MLNQLMKHLPNYYQTSQVMTNITNADDIELQTFKEKAVDVANQFFVDTATYTLERWENDLGIPIDTSKPDDYRRSVIKSKLRGSGTVTVKLIDNVAESFTNGECDIIENNSNYSFTVKFTGTLGIPPNYADFQKAIEDIKPAHLAVEYVFTYNTHAVLAGFSYGHLSFYSHIQLRENEVV